MDTFVRNSLSQVSYAPSMISAEDERLDAGLLFTANVVDDNVDIIGPLDFLFYPGAGETVRLTFRGFSLTQGILEVYKNPTLADGTSSGAGDLTITIRGIPEVISVLDGQTAAQLATSIAAGTWTGWTAADSGDTVVFTAGAVGVKTGTNAFDIGAVLDAYGSIVVTTPGTAGVAEVITLSLFAFGGTDVAFHNANFGPKGSALLTSKIISGVVFSTPGTRVDHAIGTEFGQGLGYVTDVSCPVLFRFTTVADNNTLSLNFKAFEAIA